jgi:cytochrome c oxidase subunit 4
MSHDTTHTHTHPWTPYAITLGVLLVLTVITVVAAGINFGSNSINVIIALSIATVKATLVALYFMHLRHDKPINAVIAVSGFMFLGLLLIFCLTDIDNRDNLTPGTLKVAPAKPAAAAPAAPQPAH